MFDNEINFEQIKEWLLKYRETDDVKTKKQLQNVIAMAAMPLVKRISRGLARRNTDPVEDIIQVGSVGLIKAIKFYNPEVSQNFKTYATYLITGEIRHYLRDKASMIKAPREIHELAYRVNQLIAKMKDSSGNIPSELQLATELDTPVQKIKEVIDVERRKKTISLDQMVSVGDEDYQALGDKIADDNYQNLASFQENKILITDAIEMLDPKLQEVITMNYFDDMSQTQIAAKLGISQMQVSRRIRKALNQLFHIISDAKGQKE
ncbi:MAG: sigma-70 family RNA polymerase sigma factor [Candidatus Gastranaerophilales bacterium]|nr:sigma-70 family RNA polymerase sigma factor [Candidatus Gastranaerophilales bacterium]